MPLVQKAGSSVPFRVPKLPAFNTQPVAGVMLHTTLPGVQLPLSLLLFKPDVLVTSKRFERHIVSLGDVEKEGTGFCETYIGTTVAKDCAQGFVANIVAENELGKLGGLLVPHEVFKKVWLILAGGGWVKFIGGVPSLKVTV